MGNIVQAEANAILASSVTGAEYTLPTRPIMLALVTANGSATAAGTEVVNDAEDPASTYARKPTNDVGDEGIWGTPSAGVITNSEGSISFTNMPEVGSPGVVGIELWDSTSGTPVRRWFGALVASKIINKGDTVTFTESSLTIRIE